ncbi:hypothetical protein B5E65_05930 [Gemmiger sp. An120]|uniref:CvpA family protein n=1 Tax=Gemmiger TaxID=204475 RepID=UPI000B384407|nr:MULTISPECIES: CvpA family protein [Gemmiger]MBM6915096.1 CvpA family protein [Gemmiger formicilis]OUQ42865.1 hypothetical protein B5E65_05930 [Gemmiger sp. An120]HIX33605.1 CvpA family protein [Candidatus Gemmiger avium]
MTIANIFDILLLVLLAVVTLRYMQKGFLAGLIQFLGNLLGLVGAALLSPRVADWIFATFFKGGLTTQIQTTISQQGTVDLAALVDKYAGFLPDAMEQSLVQSATDLMNSGAPDLAHSLVTELIQPLVTPLITVVVFFVCFAVCKMLVSFLAAVLTNLNRVPLVGGVNQFFGFFMGLLAGAMDVFLVVCGVWAVVVITGNNLSWLNQTVLQDSVAFSLFSSFNPFM